MAPTRWKNVNAASKVEGRVRCHKCRLICLNAAHYLGHKCESPNLNLANVGRFNLQEVSSDLRGQSVRRAVST